MIEITQVNDPKEIPLSGDLYTKAFHEGITLSALLETINPTQPGDDSGIDAFGRQLKRFGIVTKNDPAHGIYASQGKLFFSSNQPSSIVLFPEYINRRINVALMERGDLLQYIVPADHWEYGSTFRSFYMDDTEIQRRGGKRAEGAPPRKIKASWSEKHVHIEDFALEVDASYEFISEATLPVLDVMLQRVALQRSLDELGEAIYVALNGDGTGKESSGAHVDTLSDMGVTTPSGIESLDFKAWLKWQSQFYPYKMTSIFGSVADLVDFYTMTTPSDQTYPMLSAIFETSGVGGKPVFVQSPFGPVNLIPFSDSDILGTDDILGVDPAFALWGHRNTQIPLVETDRLIREKWQIFVISNKVGFSNLFRAATRKLDGDA
jgi:hypothetical protein